MEAINGKWVMAMEKSENMAEFLKAAGFPAEAQTEYMTRQYQQIMEVVDDKTIKANVSVINRPNLGSKDYVFILDQEVEIEGLDGEKSKCTVSWDGTKFVDIHKGDFGEFKMVKEIKGDEMVTYSTIKGVTLTEVWKKC